MRDGIAPGDARMAHHVQMPPLLPYIPTVKPEETRRQADVRRLRGRNGATASDEPTESDATAGLHDIVDAATAGMGGRSRGGGRGAGSSPRKAGPVNRLLSDETLKTVLSAQEHEQE
jgi:hypothetical protein